ncbi:very-long-chain (3R)-3-hydroxyacyl-CoA dehydratase PASTICCINO 2A-like [Malus sylvestris]|uniref:very-long-chain (3R)-3-hydroxyacyl-CoA dehydratase PASTICCINO 2A-like n=1 Tax=Malus sylvestris TaxID=3752 RepID=UPI0021ABBBF9|nr:very-long-chain (3R)-3-hydroxyacyl-CoA dehydratase PASTICCINO 2A-like [Malus sylvestris]
MAGLLSALRRLYLSLYNWTVFLGWFQVLRLALKTLSESGHQHVYNAVERRLLLAQSAAVLEIVHGLVALVRSPVTATLRQIGSRLYLTWGILWSFPETRSHMLVCSLVISWSITEEALGFAPSWLLWLRYSTFILLYPTGITSEVGLIYIALPHMKNSEKYSIRMPNKWNFCFDYFYAAIVALGIYVPGMHRFHGHIFLQYLNNLTGFSSFSRGLICRRDSLHVRVYAWTEEESSCKGQRGVDGNKVLIDLLLGG